MDNKLNNFINLTSQIAKFREVLLDLMGALERDNVDPTKISEINDWFFEEGWYLNFGDNINGLYSGGEAIKRAVLLRKTLMEEGINIKELSDSLDNDLKNIWRVLPNFYSKQSIENKFPTPAGYDPEVPFPQLFS